MFGRGIKLSEMLELAGKWWIDGKLAKAVLPPGDITRGPDI